MIVGITGFAGAGKDTVANYIREFDSRYVRLSFASKLKDMTSVLFGWDREMLEGLTPEAREKREQLDIELSEILGIEISPREALKKLGVGLRELFIHNFWASIVKHQILSQKLENVLITDVRFKDEIEMIRSLGGIIIEINRNKPDWYDKAKEANLIIENLQKTESLEGSKSVEDIYPELALIHPSERDWIGVNKPNFVIDNSKDFDFLKNQVKVLYENVLM